MDTAEALLLALGGLGLAILLVVTVLIVWYGIYTFTYVRRVLFYSLNPTNEQIPLYLTLLLASVIDAIGFVVSFFQTFGTAVSEKVISRLPLIFGLVLLSFGAMAWTEYHDVYIARGMDVWQCIVTWLFYDLRLMTFVNLGRLVYNIVWPVVRYIARMTRFVLRTLPVTVLRCASTEVFSGLANIGNGVLLLGKAVADWAGGPGSIANCTLDITLAAADITFGIQRISISTSICTCEAIDFVPEIAFGWVSHESTVSLINSTVVLFADAFVKIPVRMLTGTNKGTVPGITADYGYVPNLDPLFNDMCAIVRAAVQVANRFVYIAVRELVGIFDPSLFMPGSPEEIVLASDWFGFVGHVACAGVEAGRWIYRVLWSLVLLVINAITNTFGATPPVPLLCDLREWRALYDFGGLTGLYYKDGGIGGELARAAVKLQSLIGYLSDPIVGKLAVPPLRLAYNLVIGTLNLLLRFITHGIDSEFRMFNPVEPPRTGIPATAWMPPTAHAPAPLDCSATTLQPGNYWVWLQHHFDDPEGGHLLIVDVDVTEFAEGLNELGSLALPALGEFLQKLVLLPAYLFDYLIQSAMAVNIIFTEIPVNFALFASRWRYQRYLDAYSQLGDGLGDSIRELHPGTCMQPSDGIFCALGKVVDDGFAIADEVGVQLMLVFTTTRLQDIQLPNFQLSIAAFEGSLTGFATTFTVSIPPLPLLAGVNLAQAVGDVLVTFPRAALLVLTVPNYAIASFQVPLDKMKASDPFGDIALSLGDWFTNLTTFAVNDGVDRLCDASPEALIPALGTFLDRITNTTIFSPLFGAFCVIIEALRVFATEFALRVLGLFLAIFGRFLDIFFNRDNSSFGLRLTAFLDAIGALIGFIVTELPLFVLELFFGLIEAILPEPLKSIFGSVTRALIAGLCTTIQFFISTAIDILNFFGAGLDLVDLMCGTKKRSDVDSMEEGRKALVRVMVGAYQSSRVVQRRADRIRNFFATMKRFDDASEGADASTFGDIIYANASHLEHYESRQPIQMSLDQAMRAIAEFAEWKGDNLCGKIVLDLAHTGRSPDSLSVVERALLEDCISKRALGEIVSILPYLHWFPQDGFYNPMSWPRLGIEGLRAYRIFAQYNQDHSLPREAVLSEAYRDEWGRDLRVDHLTAANYKYMLLNMTLMDYFERNGGNYELIRGVMGLWNATRQGTIGFGNYLDRVSQTLDARVGEDTGSSPLEGWLYGVNRSADDDIPDSILHRQEMWRAMLQVVRSGVNIARVTVNVGYAQGVPSKLYAVAAATPRLVYNAATWMASEPTEEWKAAVKQRDELLAQHGVYSNATHRTAISGIFGTEEQPGVPDRLRGWASAKLQRATAMLRPNDPRARRNWQIINQFSTDATNAVRFGFLPDRDGNRPYAPQYATGLTELDAQGSPVAVLATCNATLVPFCLNCQVVDGILQEFVIGGIEFIDYFDTTYPQYQAEFDATQAYIDSDVINVCGGNGMTEIHFPSDVELLGSTTVFDVFGGNGGAFNGLVNFLQTEIGSVISAVSREDVYARIRRLFAGQLISTDGGRGRQRTAASQTYITDYLNSHTDFDPTYDGISAFADITIVTQALDDFHSFLGDTSFSFDIELDPFGNGTVELPTIDTGSSGFFGDIFSAFIAADYAYMCEDRLMSLKQGLVLFTVLGIVFFLVLQALGTAVLPESFSTMIALAMTMVVLPFAFFVVVYGVPVQNLFFLPLPTPPPCFANDVVDALTCDVIPKCPAFVGGLIDGPYTEENCRTCPFELDIANCKRDFGMRNGPDTIVFTLEWWFPSFMDMLRSDGGVLAQGFALIGADITRYEGTDLSIKSVFDALVSCTFVIGIASIPSILLAILAAQITTAVFGSLVVGLIGKAAAILFNIYLLADAIGNLLTYNFIYVVTPYERTLFYQQAELSLQARRKKRAPRVSFPRASDLLSRAVLHAKTSIGADRIFSGRSFEYMRRGDTDVERGSSLKRRHKKRRHRKDQ